LASLNQFRDEEEQVSDSEQSLKAQVVALRVEVERLQSQQRRAVTWDWVFHPLTVLAISLGASLAFAAWIIVDNDLSNTPGRHGFYLYYMVPLAAPLTAFALDRAKRAFEPHPLQWAVDLPVIALGLVRALYNLPGISGHALFLAYALLTCRMRVAQFLATVVLAQVAYLKIFVWHDITILGGVAAAAIAAALFRFTEKWVLREGKLIANKNV